MEARNIVRSDKYRAIFDTVLETEKVDHWRTKNKEDMQNDPDKA